MMSVAEVYERASGIAPGEPVLLSWADYGKFSDMLIATPLPTTLLGHPIVIDFGTATQVAA